MKPTFKARVAAIAAIVACVAFFVILRSATSSASRNSQSTLAPGITATKAVTFAPGGDVDGDGKADPGDTLQYTVTVNNTAAPGAGNDATGVTLSDSLSSITSLVAGSDNIVPLARNNTYNAIGNVQMVIPDGVGDVLDNDTDFDGGTLTVTGVGVDAASALAASNAGSPVSIGGATVTIQSNGALTVNPARGITTAINFFYAISDGTSKSTGQVTVNVAGTIWFVNTNAGACVSTCDGRFTNPYTTLAAFNAANALAGGADPDTGDAIFLYTSAGSYVAPLTLRASQVLVGQGASSTLLGITSIAAASGTSQIPATGGVNPTITSAGAGITVNANNTIRGLTVGNTGGAKIAGTSFGTLTIGNNTTPDVTLNGTGQALNLTTGTFAATSAFSSVTTTSSSTQGIILTGIAGTAAFGSTTVSGSATQGILIGTTTANINFGNTSVTGGTDGVSFQNNSSGTRTFGTLSSTAGGTGNAFLHGAGGGNVTVNGLATLASGSGSVAAIDACATGTAVNFSGGLTLTKSSGTNFGLSVNNCIGNVTVTGTTTIGTSGSRFPTTAASITGGTGTFSLGTVSIFTNGSTGITTTTDGTLNVAAGTVDTNAGTAINVVGPAGITTLGITLATVNSSGGTYNVNVTNANGSLTISGGALSNSTGGPSFNVSGGTAAISDAGTVSQSGAQRVINVGSMTGGSVSFSGAVTASGTSSGVQLTNNTGATIGFTGGLSLSTSANDAFTATGGGTISATQNNTTIVNTITTTMGAALNVANTTIGASGLTFRSISSNGSLNGIILSNTGVIGGFSVVGNSSGQCGGSVGSGPPSSAATATSPNSADCSGGTIQNTSGAAVVLSNTFNISLTRMWIKGAGDDGIQGTSVTNFALISSLIENNGNSIGEAEIDFGGVGNASPNGLFGSSSITNSTIRNSFEKNASIRNQNNTLTITVAGSQFNNISSNTSSDDGLGIDLIGTASVTVNAQGNYFEANRGDHFQTSAANSASLNVTFKNNTLKGGHSTALGQGITINAATAVALGGYSGRVDYDIDGNNIQGAVLNAVAANLGTSGSAAVFDGFIRNNIIGNAGVALSCSSTGNGIGIDAHGNGMHNVAVTNNTLRRCFDRGIFVLPNDGNGFLNITVTGNSINTFTDTDNANGTPREAFHLNAGATSPNVFGQADGHSICLSLTSTSGNMIGGAFKTGDIRLRQRFRTGIHLPGYGGGAFDTTAVQNFIQSTNPGAVATASSNDDPAVTTDGYLGGSGCTQPSLPLLSEESVSAGEVMKDLSFLRLLYGTASDGLLIIDNPLLIQVVTERNAHAHDGVPGDDPIAVWEAKRSRESDYGSSQTAHFEGLVNKNKNQDADYCALTIAHVSNVSHALLEFADRVSSFISPTAHAQESELVSSGGTVNRGPFTLPAGDSAQLVFKVTVDNGPYAAGVDNITNQASVSGSNFGPVNTNTTSIALDAAPDLQVTASDGGVTTQPGVVQVYAVSYQNNTATNGQNAAAVRITQTVPTNTTFNAANSTGSWSCADGSPQGTVCTVDVGAVNAGASAASVNFAVNVPALLPVGAIQLSDTASIAENPVAANGTDRVVGNNSSTDTTNIIGNWLGGTTVWETASNWSNNTVPPAGNNISVPNTANQPVLGSNQTVNLVTLNKNLTIGSTFTLTANGNVSLGANIVDGLGTLELGTTSAITRTTGQVNSSLTKNFVAPGPLFVMPVGTTGQYSPLDVTMTAGSGSLTVKANPGDVPTTPPGVLTTTQMLKRYWTVTEGGSITANVVFHYLDADVPVTTTESSWSIFRVAGGTPFRFNTDGVTFLVNPAANTFTVNGLETFSDWTAGNPLAPTAAHVRISGRVLTAEGYAIRNARVTVIDQNGIAHNAITNTFGHYYLDDLEVGPTYLMNVSAKQYRFVVRPVSLLSEMSGFDIYAEP
jgi:hypothetical protein